MTRFLSLLTAALAANSTSAQVSNANICSSAAFQALHSIRLGDSPIFMRALVLGNEVCIEYQLEASVASLATWFGVGPSRTSSMVSSPAANVMMFFKNSGTPASYLLGGYVKSDVTEESNQSAFVVGSASTTSMRFSFQRTLAAASSSEVAISAAAATDFIWAYGTSWPISTHRSGTNGAATFDIATAATATGSNNGASTTVGSASTPWCDDKNCPGIVGGVAFIVMAACGLLLTTVLKNSPIAKVLLHRSMVAPPVKLTTNDPVAKPHAMFFQTLADLYVGEVVMILIFVAAVVVLAAMLSDMDNYIVSGQISVLILMFLILPVARLQVWSMLFGSSFERIVKFHRWLGFIMSIAVIVHVIQASKVVNLTLNEKYGKVTPLPGFIAFICIIMMVILSIEYIRRMFFEVFYFTHRVLSIVGFVFSILHAPKLVGFALCVPLGLYALGLLHRWSSAAMGSYKASATVHSGSSSTTLVLEPTATSGKMAMNVNSGSYFFVRLPAISATQWHPFSSIVTPEGKSLGFCIKAMGNGSFTRKLLEKVGTQAELTANLCGPFGKLPLDVERYDAVVLIAGGVGIAPMMSIINQTHLFHNTGSDTDNAPKTADWYVLWSVREPEDLLMMEQFLPTHFQLDYAARASIQDPNMTILDSESAPKIINWMFHVSNAPYDGAITRSNGETLSYRGGKPILDELVNTSRFNARKVTVVACGPPTMTVEAQALARNCNFDFHKEVFNW
ncbi:Transmembrane protein [Phytophthora megakarya]|uniref:Transmembrane protein n=1 Tax=Phytophthora megakarya TaxID=4795 RepID=A0A225VDA9_9STRA|nr:Transmembrane protein [Phytophthora megakarya]